jgi:hypothetical protein
MVFLLSISMIIIAVKVGIIYYQYSNLNQDKKDELETGDHSWKGNFYIYKHLFELLRWQLAGLLGILSSYTLIQLLMDILNFIFI